MGNETKDSQGEEKERSNRWVMKDVNVRKRGFYKEKDEEGNEVVKLTPLHSNEEVSSAYDWDAIKAAVPIKLVLLITAGTSLLTYRRLTRLKFQGKKIETSLGFGSFWGITTFFSFTGVEFFRHKAIHDASMKKREYPHFIERSMAYPMASGFIVGAFMSIYAAVLKNPLGKGKYMHFYNGFRVASVLLGYYLLQEMAMMTLVYSEKKIHQMDHDRQLQKGDAMPPTFLERMTRKIASIQPPEWVGKDHKVDDMVNRMNREREAVFEIYVQNEIQKKKLAKEEENNKEQF